MNELYIGLMSGTSLDAIDAALVDFSRDRPALIGFHSHPLADGLRQTLLGLIGGRSPHPIQCLGELDHAFGEAFAEAVLALLQKSGLAAADIRAIGSHGQTLFHHPVGDHPFSLQIGDANLIAERTGITTVADFRRRDMAAGGQGAPLAPAFHAAFLSEPTTPRAVLNIGGMANLTLLPHSGRARTSGFDTGPGNVLLDAWAQRHLGTPFDKDGAWARQAMANPGLLAHLLDEPFFRLAPPKSTGRELFSLAWLEAKLADLGLPLAPQTVQATLSALTVHSIATALHEYAGDTRELLVCGGGVHNEHLLAQLQTACPGMAVHSTAAAGIDPDALEAMAFAWLARQALLGRPGNLPSVTGASGSRILGVLYPA